MVVSWETLFDEAEFGAKASTAAHWVHVVVGGFVGGLTGSGRPFAAEPPLADALDPGEFLGISGILKRASSIRALAWRIMGVFLVGTLVSARSCRRGRLAEGRFGAVELEQGFGLPFRR